MMAENGTRRPKIRSVKFNVVMNMILTSSSFIFPLITVPYVSRVLGPSGTGIVAWMQTLISYFCLVAVLGITTYGVRACAAVRDNREELSQTAQELGAILLISTSIVYAVYLGMIFIIPKTRENLTLAFIFSIGIWLSSCGFSWFYQAIEQYGYITVRNLAFKVIALVLMFLLVHTSADYVLYGVTTVVGGYGSNVFNLIRLRRYVDFKPHRKLDLRRHFKPMVSFTVSSISSGMYSQIDMFFAGFFVSNAMLGLYQMVVKIKNICYSAVNSVGSVMLPRISYYEAKGGHDNTRRLIGKNINFITMMSLAIMIIFIVGAEPLISLLGGHQYLGGCTALRIISPVLLFSALNTTLSQYLVARKREKEYAAVNFAGLVFGIIFCSVLIPLFGINGAALGVTLCELSALILRCCLLRDFLKEIKGETDIFKIVIATVCAFAAMAAVRIMGAEWGPFPLLVAECVALAVVDGGLLLLLRESFVMSVLPWGKKEKEVVPRHQRV